MSDGFHIHHPTLFVMPIMALSVVIQLIARRRRRRGLAERGWANGALVVLLVGLCMVGVFADF